MSHLFLFCKLLSCFICRQKVMLHCNILMCLMIAIFWNLIVVYQHNFAQKKPHLNNDIWKENWCTFLKLKLQPNKFCIHGLYVFSEWHFSVPLVPSLLVDATWFTLFGFEPTKWSVIVQSFTFYEWTLISLGSRGFLFLL